MFWSGSDRVEYNRVSPSQAIKFTFFGFGPGRGIILRGITGSGCQKPCPAGPPQDSSTAKLLSMVVGRVLKRNANPNHQKSYKDFLQNMLHIVLCNHPKPIYSNRKAYLSKLLWIAAEDSCPVCGRFQVWALILAGMLYMLFSTFPPTFECFVFVFCLCLCFSF